MKLRLEANSLRLRLKQHEVQALSEGNSVAESVSVHPMARLEYTLASSASVQSPLAKLDERGLVITLPRQWTEPWAANDEVGFSFDLPNGTPTPLSVLIEKDFKCLTPRGEEDEGAYPHPDAEHGHSC